MSKLVIIKGNNTFTNSLIIAENAEVQHHSITRIIRRHKKDFERFGSVKFDVIKSANPNVGRPTKIYQLNEQQVGLLETYLKNSYTAKRLKSALIANKMRGARA